MVIFFLGLSNRLKITPLNNSVLVSKGSKYKPQYFSVILNTNKIPGHSNSLIL